MKNDPRVIIAQVTEALGYRLSRNEHSGVIALYKDGVPIPMTDEELAIIKVELVGLGTKVSAQELKEILIWGASKNAAHPIRDYLESLTWDGTERLATWLPVYLHTDDSPLRREQGQLMLRAAVARVYKPGTKFDHMLILESNQRWNKSTSLRTLATRDEWFTDNMPLTGDSKKIIEQTTGKWIIEVAELDDIEKVSTEKLKNLITHQEDSSRLAYGHFAVERPRQFVLFGTTNNANYLRDSQNRRFWPVRLQTPADADALKRDRDQLWAEAVVQYKLGMPLFLSNELEREAAREQAERREIDPLEDKLARMYPPGVEYKLPVREVLQKLYPECVDVETKVPQKEWNRVTRTMSALGFLKKQVWANSKNVKMFVRGADWTGHYGYNDDNQVVPIFKNPFAPENFIRGEYEEPEVPEGVVTGGYVDPTMEDEE